MATLRLILGDQLSHSIPTLEGCDKATDIILMCEVWDEATYVKHHKKKIAFLFSAMRHFSCELKQLGYSVDYIRLEDEGNTGSFLGEVTRAVKRRSLARCRVDQIVVTHPGEYRVLADIQTWEKVLGIPVEIRQDNRFLATPAYFAQWAEGRKQLRMEHFYREMRRKYAVLLEDEELSAEHSGTKHPIKKRPIKKRPAGGKWNYDLQNREPPPKHLKPPEPYHRPHSDRTSISSSSANSLAIPANDAAGLSLQIIEDVMDLVKKRFPDHFGDLEPFYFAVTRKQALEALKHFIDNRLKFFGEYQDAMLQGEPWMYHSHISFYLNCGLLMPLECVRAAEDAYYREKAPLNAVEGFIRQIIGWREFVRGIYWLAMPTYVDKNFFMPNANCRPFIGRGKLK